jgi:hypothetical protein
VTKRSLEGHLEAVILPDQPPETERALGVAFAQRSAGWTLPTWLKLVCNAGSVDECEGVT